MKTNRYILVWYLAVVPLLTLPPLPPVFGATLTLTFYNSGGQLLTFSQVQSTQTGTGPGATAADAFLDPTTLRCITPKPMTDAGSLSFSLPTNQPVALAINWPTATQGYGLVIIDNGGGGYSNSASVNFTYQAAQDTRRKLDVALATRPDYTRSAAFSTAYNAATNNLNTADQSSEVSVKGAQGQLALDQLVVAYDLLLKEYGPFYARAHQSTTPPWLGFTMEDISNYTADLDKLTIMAGPYAWVRMVFQPGLTPSYYTAAVNYAKAKGIKVLGLPVDSSSDTTYTRAQYLQRYTNFITALPGVDAWEAGNEVNGGWSSSDIASRVADVAAYCKGQGKKTYLTLFWQLNTSASTFSLFNWLATNLPVSVRANLDYVGLSLYQEQAPMGGAFDQVMRRMQVEFPKQQIGLGELGYWIKGQQYWWAYSTNVTVAKHAIMEQYYKASAGYAGAHGAGFWWNFASGGAAYDFDATMTNTISALRNYLLLNTNGPTCPASKTVQCGAAWSFDLPTAAGLCTNSNITVSVIDTLTNSSGPQTVITRNWLVTDPCNNTNTCSQSITVTDDTQSPTIAITSPTAVDQTNAAITVSGTASDNIGVAQVSYQLNGGILSPTTDKAGNFTKWSAAITLQPGNNTFRALSFDGCGNAATNTRPFFYIATSPLTLRTLGSGNVKSLSGQHGTPTNGSLLQIGRGYSVTAVPNVNNLFSHWLSVADGLTNVAGTNAGLKFLMRSNLTLIANFVTNRFPAIAGTYRGLFSDTNSNPSHTRAGLLNLTVRARPTLPAAFSGRIWLDGETISFQGSLNLDGSGTTTKPLARKGKAPLSLNVRIPFDGSDTLSGMVSNADDNWSSTLNGFRQVFDVATNPASAFAGTYTLTLPAAADAGAAPGGHCYGFVSIATNGKITLIGGLGDGANLSQTTYLSREGQWPLYSPAYLFTYTYDSGGTLKNTHEYGGSAWGWVSVGSNAARNLTGKLSWQKINLTNQTLYPDGFHLSLNLLASPYTNLAPTLPLNSGSGLLVLSNGNLAGTLQNSVTLSALNKFTPSPGHGLTLILTPATGKLTGSFLNPYNSNALTRIFGTVLQNLNAGRGYFSGTNQSGALVLQGN